MGSLTADPESRLADPAWVLANFTLAADLTTLRERCRLARNGDTLVARYLGLPFAALAFWGGNSRQVADLAARLIGSEERFYVLVNEQQAPVAESAFLVEQAHPEWQMLFSGDVGALDAGQAMRLGPDDIDQMRDLADNAGLMALEADPFRYGPAYGIWEASTLVSMGTTHLLIPGAAELGNVATRTSHRRQGLAQQVVSALVQAHVAEQRQVFLMVFQSNQAAIGVYEQLGFARARPMFLMRCQLPDGALPAGQNANTET
jgi:ribosomal protein S18 acetylase RimI-like enzyme